MVSLHTLSVEPLVEQVKLLYVAYFFPPTTAVAGRRFRQLVERHKVVVGAQFAVTNQPQETADTPVEVYGVNATDLRRILNSSRTHRAPDGTNSRMRLSRLLPLRQAYPFLYLTDDGGPIYRQKAYQKATELIEKHGITTVFSSFRPWSDHLVARKLKRTYPRLHWIADFRDLPVDPVRKDVWWPALQTWWGKRVIATADEVWVVSEGQREQFRGWHPNIRVVRNALLRLPPARSAPVTERFTIVYTGSLYPRLQTVAPLVAALQKLVRAGTIDARQLCFRYRGKDAELFREWMSGLPAHCLDVQPSIAPAAAQKMQQDAQVLLLLNWSAPGYYGVLTAKLWDYLASGRPILALVNGPGDRELSGIIEGANAGAVFGVKEQGQIVEWVEKAYLRWAAENSLPWSVDRENLRQYL